MVDDPVRQSLLQGPAREMVDGARQMGWDLAVPTGAAGLTQQPGQPKVLVIGVVTTPPDALTPLFAAARRRQFEGESVTWVAGDIGSDLDAAYVYLDVYTRVPQGRHFSLILEEFHMWRGFLAEDPPDWMWFVDGNDDRVSRLFQGRESPQILEQVDLFEVPNPPLPYAGIRYR